MDLKRKIVELIEPVIEENDFDLVELKLSHFKQSNTIRLFVDSDNGVKLEDCAKLSKAIDVILEDNNMFRSGYTIEVSSPGLDRPLQTRKEFKRRIGKQVQILFNQADQSPIEGELTGVDDLSVELLTKEGPHKIDLAGIKMGKIIL
jgi:ribosome maturation factor RimP